MSPRDVKGKYAVKNCGEAYAEWNYNTLGSESFLHKSNQLTKSLTPIEVFPSLTRERKHPVSETFSSI